MTVIEKKPVPLYEVVCYECGSKLRYKASDVRYSHITCPVCYTSLWAMTHSPVAYEESEPPKDEAPTGPYDLLYEEGGAGTT